MSQEPTTPEPPSRSSLGNKVQERLATFSFVQHAILLLAVAYTLYFIRPVLLPIILSLLLSLILKPIHRYLCKLKLPSPMSSLLIILTVLGLLGTGIYYLSAPAVEYTDKLRNEIVKNRLKSVFYPIAKIQKEISQVATEVEKITNTGEDEGGDDSLNQEDIKDEESINAKTGSLERSKIPNQQIATLDETFVKPLSPVKVNIATNPIDELVEIINSVGYYIVVTLTLVYFILAYGEKMLNRITEVDLTAKLMDEVTNEVSRYMFTITIINIVLGLVIGLAMWALGMPNPVLWGVLAAVLNFIPYIGAIVGTCIVFLVAATHYDQSMFIILVPGVYYLTTLFEGNFVTPAILGESFTVNPIIIFVWVLCWGAFWGIPGMLIGLPLLMTCRIILSRWQGFKRIERIIST